MMAAEAEMDDDGNEIDDLKAEGEMPIEELRAKLAAFKKGKAESSPESSADEGDAQSLSMGDLITDKNASDASGFARVLAARRHSCSLEGPSFAQT